MSFKITVHYIVYINYIYYNYYSNTNLSLTIEKKYEYRSNFVI